MTDNEIIKALECYVGKMDCDSCPYGAEHGVYCIKVLHRHSLEVITRQKAEIERLSADRYLLKKDGTMTLLPRTDVSKIKAEAIKEFAEYILSLFPSDKDFTTISRFSVKRKAKEMVGERE